MHGKSLLGDLILACARVLCSAFSLHFKWPKGWGLTTFLAVCSSSPQVSFLGFFFLHPRFSLLFHTLFPADNPSLKPLKPPLGNAIFFLFTFLPFQWVYLQGWKNRRRHFGSASLQASVYAAPLLQNVLNIWIKKLLLLSDSSVFSLIPSICNVKSSISLWKVLNLFLPFILVLCWTIFRSQLSTVNYFLSSLPR